MIAGLEARLAELAAQRQVTTYGVLAADLGLTGPGRIARLTAALEALMETDTQAGHPLRAALVVGRASAGLPARGFFDMAQALGHDVTDPDAFHKAQINGCFVRAR